jgi:outer membrane biosynthesis protein TonB
LILNPAAVPDMAAAPLAKLGQAEVVMFGFHEAALLAVGPEKVDLLVYVPFVEYGAAAVKVLDGITRRHENYPNEVMLPVTAVTLDNLEKVNSARKKMLAGNVSAVIVVPSGGAKPNQPVPAEAEQPKPAVSPPVQPSPPAPEQPKPAETPAAPQAGEQPKPTEPTPPAEAKPAAEKPAAEKPAESQPAAEKPAAEKPAESSN